jgi:hypothetical protein
VIESWRLADTSGVKAAVSFCRYAVVALVLVPVNKTTLATAIAATTAREATISTAGRCDR